MYLKGHTETWDSEKNKASSFSQEAHRVIDIQTVVQVLSISTEDSQGSSAEDCVIMEPGSRSS